MSITRPRPPVEPTAADLCVRFQRDVFVDNRIGYRNKAKAEIQVPGFQFDPDAIQEFAGTAREWLGLPIAQLGKQYFRGEWQLGADIYQLNLKFQPYPSTPSKTDWFEMNIHIQVDDQMSWNADLHIDYTGLSGFVTGLCAEGHFAS